MTRELDATFRIVLSAAFLLFVPVAFTFRIKSRTDETLDRRLASLIIGIWLAGRSSISIGLVS